MNTGSSSFGNNSSRPRLGASLAGVGSNSYFYDSLGQLTRQTDGWGSYQYQYQYDAVGQLLSSVSPLSQERFAFDPAHNLVPVGSSGSSTNQVGADPINQGASSQGLVDDFGRLTVYEDKRYTYDAHGRLLSKRIGKHTHLQLHWNAEHQLVQSQRLDPQTGTVLSTTHYRYDPFGRRMAKLTLNELGQESKAKLASKVAGQVNSQANSQATLFVWDGNRILQEIESNGFEVVLPPSASVDGVVKAIQVPASRTRLYVYEPDSFVPLAQAEWASPLQTFSLPEPSVSQASNEKVLHDFAYFPYTTPSNATHWQVPGTNIVAPLPSFEQAQQQALQDQQRQKANSQQTGPQQWPDVLPLSSLAIKPAHPPVFKAENVGLDEAYFNKASEARAVDGERNNAPENASNDETNNTPSLAKAQAIMQQLQPEEAALLAHVQASFNAVANKIKQASNDARLNPFKEPTPPPQGSAKQVRIRYYHCDQLGTPKELTSSSGELVWYAQYKAWGNKVKVEWLQGPVGQEVGFEWGQVEGASSSSQPNTIQIRQQTQAQVQPIRFQGQYYDWETGLHYNRFRYYDPDCGRFICKDPIGLAGGLNLFQYAPNPVGWVDPFGLVPKTFKVDGVTNTLCIKKKFPAGSAEAKELEKFTEGWNEQIQKNGGSMTKRRLTKAEQDASNAWKKTKRCNCGAGQVVGHMPDASMGNAAVPDADAWMVQMAETNRYLAGIAGNVPPGTVYEKVKLVEDLGGC